MRATYALVAIMLLALVSGCVSTAERNAEYAFAREKLAEFVPRLELLHEGMSRTEVEEIIRPYQKCGTINTSGFMWSHYYLSPHVLVGLHYHSGSQEGDVLPADTLLSWKGQAHVLIKTRSGHQRWIDLPIYPLKKSPR